MATCLGHAADRKQPPTPEPSPSMQFDMKPFGFQRISRRILMSGRSSITVNFAGTDRVLITFGIRKLMKRDPNETENDHDRELHVVLLELPAGKLIAETDWRVHDEGQYLWPLSEGRFLLRERNRLRILDPAHAPAAEALQSHPVFDAGNGQELTFVDVTADGTMVELQTHRGKMIGDDLDLEGDPDANRIHKTLIRFYAVDPVKPELRLKGRSEIQGQFHAPFNAQGFLSVSDEDATHWGFDFHTFSGETKELAGLETSCSPQASFLSESRFLVAGCRGGEARNMMGVLDLDGHVLWLGPRDQLLWAGLYPAPGSGRFAVRRTLTNTPSSAMLVDGIQETSGQRMTVLRSATGEELMHVTVIPAMQSRQNFALSEDGRQLAVWNDDTVEIYALPQLTEKDKETVVAGKSGGVVLVPAKP
ncbi:MAG: hypothetical protein JSS87_08645 [Acidobacteria bacterium]|nr:hypothetical protein [Acidobacteriota bacterium]